jgi:hypothetical protein
LNANFNFFYKKYIYFSLNKNKFVLLNTNDWLIICQFLTFLFYWIHMKAFPTYDVEFGKLWYD